MKIKYNKTAHVPTTKEISDALKQSVYCWANDSHTAFNFEDLQFLIQDLEEEYNDYKDLRKEYPDKKIDGHPEIITFLKLMREKIDKDVQEITLYCD